ncbi:MAG: sugar ABC transporter ATP-binding protein [Rubripirellula sp.]
MSDPVLSVHELTKRFAVTVLDRVSLELRGGEIHALMGANGAGKSTLCRIVAGLLSPTSGQMRLNGASYSPLGKQDAELAGVQIVQQELNLIPTLSVAENLMLGRMPQRLGLIDRRRLIERAQVALDRLGIRDISPKTMVGALGVGHQQMIEIAAAIDRDCRVLILDEPTSALSAGETETLFERLDQLRGQGIGMFYISHRLHEVERMSDRISVLRDGRWVCTHNTTDVNSDQMVALMTDDLDDARNSGDFFSHKQEKPALRVEGMTRANVVQKVSLAAHRGERLGIAGLVGAGRTELIRLIFGADKADHGRLFLNERERQPFLHPRQAVSAKIAMVTENRKEDGLLLTQSVRANTTLASLQHLFSAVGLLREKVESETVQSICDQLDTRCETIEQSVATLSGGNQQKVAVSKWLLSDFDIFLFDEPTRGIDVAARRRLYTLFETLASKGKALIIVSSDIEELMENCDRIAVMSAGKLVETFARDDWSEDRIMHAAFAGQCESTS